MKKSLLMGVVSLGLALTACGGREQDSSFQAEESAGEVEQRAGTTVRDFSVGIQLIDQGSAGATQYSSFASAATSSWSNYAFDGDSDNSLQDDPDGARLYLQLGSGTIPTKDFQICIRAKDDTASSQGVEQCTPWASAGGGWSELASDNDFWDPNAYQIIIRTQAWVNPETLTDFQLGLQVVDEVCPWYSPSCDEFVGGTPQFTRWASEGSSNTEFAFDGDDMKNPDGIKVFLGVAKS
ncbi:hypothetical protein JQX13_32050 [Archangium violaceum]|uniref:hypothetical protein n=1 Tax=Archangium violaceum TaxID=83451 RepID=UPI00193BF3D2|nr:hypothetical protein [Archangium violaceum]QRK04837.1 hypothetical protein JQX13_32050 [Archangium violaceum]